MKTKIYTFTDKKDIPKKLGPFEKIVSYGKDEDTYYIEVNWNPLNIFV